LFITFPGTPPYKIGSIYSEKFSLITSATLFDNSSLSKIFWQVMTGLSLGSHFQALVKSRTGDNHIRKGDHAAACATLVDSTMPCTLRSANTLQDHFHDQALQAQCHKLPET
jgi:hypothetical protein